MDHLKAISQSTDIKELLDVYQAARARISELRDTLPIYWGDGSRHDQAAHDAYEAGKPVILGGGEIAIKGLSLPEL